MRTPLVTLIEHAKLTPVFDFNVSARLRKTKMAAGCFPDVLYGQAENINEIHEALNQIVPGHYEVELDLHGLKYEIDTAHGELPYLKGYDHAHSVMMLVDEIEKASMNFRNE